MKKITMLAASLLVSAAMFGQYYYIPYVNAGTNPGGLNTDAEYPSGGGLPSGWATIHSGSATSPAWSTVQNLPFAFKFNGASVSKFKVSTSGILTFSSGNTTAPSYTKAALPNASIPDSSVCIWGIAGQAANDYIISKTFGSAPNRQFWVMFNSYGYGTTPSDGSNSTYWSIVMEETSNNIYIVDSRTLGFTGQTTVSAGIQINSTTAYSIAGSPALAAKAGTDATSADNTYYQFIPGTQPQYDLSVKTNTMAKYLVLGSAPFDVTGSITNYGTDAVTSFDLNYQIDGGATVTQNITGVNIAKFASYNFTHPTKWNPSAVGAYSVKVWASNINGNADGNTANDALTTTINVVDAMVNRKLLHEGFSSSTCGPCNPGNVNVNTVLNGKDENNYTYIKYQMNYPGTGDPYYTSECGTRHSYYGINSIPRLQLDGQWNNNSNSYTSALFDQYQSQPAFISITGTGQLKWKNTVDVNVTINPVTNISNNNLRLFVAICEKTTSANIKTNGETEFHHVMKKMLPDANGTTLTALTKNTAVNKSLSFAFPGPYTLAPSGASPINIATQHSVEDFYDLEVVAWVQDYSTKEILQSNHWDVAPNTGIAAPEAAAISVINTPGNSSFDVTVKNMNLNGAVLKLFNTLGQQVATATAADGMFTVSKSGLNNGLYIIRVSNNGTEAVRKIYIQE